jgi:hypothetical protein
VRETARTYNGSSLVLVKSTAHRFCPSWRWNCVCVEEEKVAGLYECHQSVPRVGDPSGVGTPNHSNTLAAGSGGGRDLVSARHVDDGDRVNKSLRKRRV